MAVKQFLLVTAVLLAVVSYFLYEPFPGGYSSGSAIKFQLILATGKCTRLLVSQFPLTGIRPHASMYPLSDIHLLTQLLLVCIHYWYS